MSHSSWFLLILFCTIVLPWALWRFSGIRAIVPCAVVQILVGILLGSSLMKHLIPSDFSGAFIPPFMREQIEGIATLAVLFFAFLTGLHINVRSFQGQLGRFTFVGAGSVAVPFALGVVAAFWVWDMIPSAAGAQAQQLTFVLAVAIALSVTALPVLGAILRDLGLIDHQIGQWSLGLAAINDAALWLLIAMLLAMYAAAPVSGGDNSGLTTIVLAIVYVAFMYGVARPLLKRWLTESVYSLSTDALLVGATAFTLVSAFATEWLGVHFLLGAFVAGTVLPEATQKRVAERLEHVLVLLLSPFFFVATGLKVNLDAQSNEIMTLFLVLTTVTVVGKYLGTTVPAHLIGLQWRESFALGSLMQAKGMMELAVLTILFDAELISGALFSALTLMALVTTALSMSLTRVAIGMPLMSKVTNS